MAIGIDLELSKQEATEMARNGSYKQWNDFELVQRQLFTARLFVPTFDIFHSAVEKVLGRPVWTHEFASSGTLKEEFEELG